MQLMIDPRRFCGNTRRLRSIFTKLCLLITGMLAPAAGLLESAHAADSLPTRIRVRGAGYVAVLLPSGRSAYLRNGKLTVDGNRMLRAHGYLLAPGISVPENTVSLTVSRRGVVSAVTSDAPEQSVALGALMLDIFPNAGRLFRLSRNLLRESGRSGEPETGVPGTTGYGQVIFSDE